MGFQYASEVLKVGSDINSNKFKITGLVSIVLLLIPIAVLCVPWSFLWIYHELIGVIATFYFVLTGIWIGNHFQKALIPMLLFTGVLAIDVTVSLLAYFFDSGSGRLITIALYFLYGGLLSDGPLRVLRHLYVLEGAYAKRMLVSALIGSLLMFGMLVLGMAISHLYRRVREKV